MKLLHSSLLKMRHELYYLHNLRFNFKNKPLEIYFEAHKKKKD